MNVHEVLSTVPGNQHMLPKCKLLIFSDAILFFAVCKEQASAKRRIEPCSSGSRMEGPLSTLRGQQHKERSPLCLFQPSDPGYALPRVSPGLPLLWSREPRMHRGTELIPLPSTRNSGMMHVLGQQDPGVSRGE